MTTLKYVIVGIQIVLSLILVVVVLFQHGSQRGLSGSIAGGAETFFGKNKGRTIDAKLKKWTAIVAVLFLVSSISLNIVITKEQQANEAAAQKLVDEAKQEMQIEDNNTQTDADANAEADADADANANAGAETDTDANANADAQTDDNTADSENNAE